MIITGTAPAGESSQGLDEDPGSILQQQELDDGGAASELKEKPRRDHVAEAESSKIMETEERQGGEKRSQRVVCSSEEQPQCHPSSNNDIVTPQCFFPSPSNLMLEVRKKPRTDEGREPLIAALISYRRWLSTAVGCDYILERTVEAREQDMGLEGGAQRRAWHSFVGDVRGGPSKVKRDGGAFVGVLSELNRVETKLSEYFL